MLRLLISAALKDYSNVCMKDGVIHRQHRSWMLMETLNGWTWHDVLKTHCLWQRCECDGLKRLHAFRDIQLKKNITNNIQEHILYEPGLLAITKTSNTFLVTEIKTFKLTIITKTHNKMTKTIKLKMIKSEIIQIKFKIITKTNIVYKLWLIWPQTDWQTQLLNGSIHFYSLFSHLLVATRWGLLKCVFVIVLTNNSGKQLKCNILYI